MNKVFSIILIALLVINLILFAFGILDALIFWVVIGLIALITFYPKYKKYLE